MIYHHFLIINLSVKSSIDYLLSIVTRITLIIISIPIFYNYYLQIIINTLYTFYLITSNPHSMAPKYYKIFTNPIFLPLIYLK